MQPRRASPLAVAHRKKRRARRHESPRLCRPPCGSPARPARSSGSVARARVLDRWIHVRAVILRMSAERNAQFCNGARARIELASHQLLEHTQADVATNTSREDDRSCHPCSTLCPWPVPRATSAAGTGTGHRQNPVGGQRPYRDDDEEQAARRLRPSTDLRIAAARAHRSTRGRWLARSEVPARLSASAAKAAPTTSALPAPAPRRQRRGRPWTAPHPTWDRAGLAERSCMASAAPASCRPVRESLTQPCFVLRVSKGVAQRHDGQRRASR